MKKLIPFCLIVVWVFVPMMNAYTQSDSPALIAFTSNRDGNQEIYVMGVDGSNPVNLSNHPSEDWHPDWSPDGQRILFTSNRNGNPQIFVMDSNGENVVNLSNSGSNDQAGAWSPDGQQIAFDSDRSGGREIWLMNADGSNPRQLTFTNVIKTDPSWSPDAQRVVFWANPSGTSEIFAVNADGTNLQPLTRNTVNDGWPSWSPDGQRIVFDSFRDGNWEVYVMNVDGTNPIRLTTAPTIDGRPSWSADGQHITFVSDRDGNNEIYVMNSDGSNAVNLTQNVADDHSPSWRPPLATDGEFVFVPPPTAVPTEIPPTREPVEMAPGVVPNIVGLSLPEAAALLNMNGLELGHETVELWNVNASQPQNRITAQSIAAGETIEGGTFVDVTIARSPNMLIIYDNNDLTLVNQSGNLADISSLRFVSTGGTSATMAATRWRSSLRPERCHQVWTELRNGFKGLDECRFIQDWFSTLNVGEHFWTATNGVQQFAVMERDVERATCPAAAPDSANTPTYCQFYLAGASAAEDVTEFIYFAYTTDAIAIINLSTDKWMPTNRTGIFANGGAAETPILMGEPTLFPNPDVIGDVSLLAPGQCILWSVNHPEGIAPPQDCNVVAQTNVQGAFWNGDFQIESALDGQRYTCPAATAGRPTLCIVPQ